MRPLIPGFPNEVSLYTPLLFAWEGEPSEVKHLSRTRKRNQHEIPLVAASENGRAQTESATATWWRCGVLWHIGCCSLS
jgi:hypothetical protein